MFARLSRAASSLLEVNWSDEEEECLVDNLEEILSFDVPELPQLRFPSAETAVHAASKVYDGVLQPFYCYVRDTLAEDVENITQALKEAPPNFATESGHVGTHDTVEYIELWDCRSTSSRDESKQGPECPDSVLLETSGAGSSRFLIPSDSPFSKTRGTTIPLIFITPAPPQERETSSWVPIQDDCFGSRLTVPMHRALNAIHPPMAPTGIPSTSYVHHWTYNRGHWWASALDIKEQEKREVFSRPRGMRRRYRASVRFERKEAHSMRTSSALRRQS